MNYGEAVDVLKHARAILIAGGWCEPHIGRVGGRHSLIEAVQVAGTRMRPLMLEDRCILAPGPDARDAVLTILYTAGYPGIIGEESAHDALLILERAIQICEAACGHA